MIEVFGRINSLNVQKVMWAAAELGLDWQRHDVGGPWGGTADPDFVAMNPNRLVPVVRDGETVVWESHACVRYLAAAYGAGSLWPEDPAERSKADRWMDWKSSTVLPSLHPLFWQLIRTRPDERDAAALERAAEGAARAFAVLDAHLADNAFVAGDRLTIGDIPLGCATYRYLGLNVVRAELPNLQRWYNALTERQAFRTHVMVPLT